MRIVEQNMRQCTPEPEVVDDLKPALPYAPGAVLRIKQHIPPAPFGPGYRPPFRRSLDRDYRERHGTPSRCCLANPPPETAPHPDQKMHSLKIVDQIACSDGRGAQLVTCHFAGHEADIFIAKIFDPLYYNWWDYDITYLADQHYSCEAAAFLRLRLVKDADETGYPGVAQALKGLIPTYRGCWTWETVLLDGQRRDVRIILMSYFRLPTMKSIIDKGETVNIPLELRMQLFAKVLELHCWLRFFGVDQRDLHPRNILIDIGQKQVVLLDFSHSWVRDLPNSRWISWEGDSQTRPKSPIEVFRCHLGVMYDEAWMPDHLRFEDAQIAWFKQNWGKSKVFAPVSDEVAREVGIDNSE